MPRPSPWKHHLPEVDKLVQAIDGTNGTWSEKRERFLKAASSIPMEGNPSRRQLESLFDKRLRIVRRPPPRSKAVEGGKKGGNMAANVAIARSILGGLIETVESRPGPWTGPLDPKMLAEEHALDLEARRDIVKATDVALASFVWPTFNLPSIFPTKWHDHPPTWGDLKNALRALEFALAQTT